MMIVLGGALVIGLVALSALLNGWALSILWGWFLVPLGLPNIGIAWAIGITCCAGALRGFANGAKSDEDNLADLIALFLGPLLVLIVGWIVKGFM